MFMSGRGGVGWETWLLLEEILLPVEPCETVLAWDLRDSCQNLLDLLDTNSVRGDLAS